MQAFRHTAAQGSDAQELLARCLRQLGAIPASANLGFVYGTDGVARDLPGLVAELRERHPSVHWVGTVGIGICATGHEFYEVPALAILVGELPEGSFRLIPDLNPRHVPEVEQTLAWWMRQAGGFALLHADPTHAQTSALLEDLGSLAPDGFINGGLTSSNGEHPQICGTATDGAVSGVLFASSVEVVTDHTQGCSPLGAAHRITEAQRNIAIRLDGRPALDVMKEDMGAVLTRDLGQTGGYIYAALPIPGSDTGDYLVRNLMGIDEERRLVAVSDYLEGQERLLFCRRDGNTAVEDLQRMLGRLNKRTRGRPIRGGVYISCIARGRHQFGVDSEELRMINEGLGEFPLVGFFANGEIYNGRVYGYTGVLTLFL